MTSLPGYCLVVPHYEHIEAFERFLPALSATGTPMVVVDDGSRDEVSEQCRSLCERARQEGADVTYLTHSHNRGKGAAVFTGAASAAAAGFTHVVQIDADGQHDVADLPTLLDASRREPGAIVSGLPVFGADAPAARVHGRKLTTAMIAIETLGGGIRDGLCGYRVYPVQVLDQLRDQFHIAPRMGFDTDVLVKARWLDVPVRFVATAIRYPEDGSSHFHYISDNRQLVLLHVRLLAGLVPRLPGLLMRRLSGRRGAV